MLRFFLQRIWILLSNREYFGSKLASLSGFMSKIPMWNFYLLSNIVSNVWSGRYFFVQLSVNPILQILIGLVSLATHIFTAHKNCNRKDVFWAEKISFFFAGNFFMITTTLSRKICSQYIETVYSRYLGCRWLGI